MTPTVALAIKIKRMTAGSTNADQKEESFESSKRASTKETTADASRMSTSWSLNCSKISSQRGVGGSSGSSGRTRWHCDGGVRRETDHCDRRVLYVLSPGILRDLKKD